MKPEIPRTCTWEFDEQISNTLLLCSSMLSPAAAVCSSMKFHKHSYYLWQDNDFYLRQDEDQRYLD